MSWQAASLVTSTELSRTQTMNRFSLWQGIIVLSLFLLPAIVNSAEPSVGQVSRIPGAKFVDAGPPGCPIRKLATGADVFAGERIRTGIGTSTHIEFTDKNPLILRPDTDSDVEQYL